ncbi:MAG: hypothetical protein HC855_08300 [Rhizobiales bacterium]|nr:hypothetical protein [Hyphomicrobiales bacterium]
MANTAAPQPEARRYSVAYFRYVGATALTVTGPVTGRTYRFPAPGAVMPVDPRDQASMMRVPILKLAAGP